MSFRILKRVQHKFISESLTSIKSIDPEILKQVQDRQVQDDYFGFIPF